MLRNLRSRRRPRYGAYVCAAISAVLLLLSVSVLHSRLSTSQEEPLHHSLDSDLLLLSQGTDDLDSSLGGEDDKIDELDTEEEPSSSSSSPGFFFDHLSASIRRSLSRRSIHDWADDHASFASLLSRPDPSRTAFASDDVPLDSDVRARAFRVNGVEDALMLNRASPLREAWSPWFDKKSEFLKRDRMFKSNLEGLNPLSNPLLQDPDGAGLTALTRGDKMLLKSFTKLPQKPAHVSERHDQVQRSERRALDHNSIDGHAKMISLDSNKDGGVSEYSGNLYADGKRWGYYPGLAPQLSFSDFMDAFFRKGKCDVKVFMVWNSPPWMYSVRQQRGLESLLSNHRDACVVIFSETIELNFFKDNFVKDGFKVAVVMPNLEELLKDTPVSVFASVWFEWRETKFYSTHYSELIRLAALYRYGGIYLDSDIMVLKPLSSLNNVVCLEDSISGSSLNGAVMAFRKHSPFIMACLKEFYMTYDDTRLRWNGADLLSRAAKKFSSKENKSVKTGELKVLPSFIFFPISSRNITRYFTAPANVADRAQQDALFQKIQNESFTFHFWNSLTSALIPEPESLVTRLINQSCIRCSDVL